MVCISLGYGAYVCINQKDELLITQTIGGQEIQINLGRATPHRLETIREYIGRLDIHAVPEKVLAF